MNRKYPESIPCECDDWKENIGKIIRVEQFYYQRFNCEYDGEFFQYCPWCGDKLKQKKKYSLGCILIGPDKRVCFEPNSLRYGQDLGFRTGIPDGVLFTVVHNYRDYFVLTAPGYGVSGSYGGGAIFLYKAVLTDEQIEWLCGCLQ